MKISTKGRYALRMMIDLARYRGEGFVPLKDISERQGISIKYLEQIANTLYKAGFLKSGRGAQGGYRLSKEPSQYSAGDILRVTEGKLAPVACLECNPPECDRFSVCPTVSFWQGLQTQIDQYVDSFTLEDFINKKI